MLIDYVLRYGYDASLNIRDLMCICVMMCIYVMIFRFGTSKKLCDFMFSDCVMLRWRIGWLVLMR